ncbi:MAG: sporulation protein [Clostridia bacterium]|nr:sporulation protein [Clostridia bacterium]
MTVKRLRRRIMRLLTYSAIMLFALGLIAFGKETSAAATEGLRLCASVLLPSLFPFFVISSLAVQTGLAGYAGRVFEKPMRLLFNVPGVCAPAFVLGLVGGYPVGARTAISLYEQHLCTKEQTERLLAFCNNSGPAFILGAVGTAIFGGTAAGVLLYLSHIAASVAVGVVFRFRGSSSRGTAAACKYAVHAVSLKQAFSKAIVSSFAAVLNICAFVIFFAVTIRLLFLTGVIPAAASLLGTLISPLGLDTAYAERLISGLFEVTSGISGLADARASAGAKLSAAAFMLGWAGLSVHCQVLNFIGDSGLNAAPYIIGKLLHGFLSMGFAYAGFYFFPFDVQASKMLSARISAIAELDAPRLLLVSVSAAAAVWAIFLLLSRILYCKIKKDRL